MRARTLANVTALDRSFSKGEFLLRKLTQHIEAD